MRTKTLSLLTLSILSLVMFMSLTSAATLSEWNLTSDGSAINVDSDVTAGTFTSSGVVDFNFHSTHGAFAEEWPTGADPLDTSKYFEVTIAPQTDSILTISNINFDYSASMAGPASFELQYSKTSGFGSPTTLTTKTDVSNSEVKTSSNSVNIQVDSGETLTLRWFGYGFTDDTNEFRIKDLEILGTVASSVEEPDEIITCGTTGNAGGDLKVKIKDVNIVNLVGGFGDDDNFWYPLDEIEVEIEVENDGVEDIDKIEVAWGLYDVDADDWIIDEEENDFNLKDGKEETLFITFHLEDPDDYQNDDYVFYVWANGEIDDGDDTPICISDSLEIEIVNNDDFVILDDITYPETASCGGDIQITADVWNVGESSQDEVKVVVYSPDLGLNEIIEIGDIDDFDSELFDTYITIPKDAEEGTAVIYLRVFDEDNDIFETDEDNDEAEFVIRITLDSCEVSSPAMVSADIESGGKAGEKLVIRSTITNIGDTSADYSINAAGYTTWASSISIDPQVFTLDAGASKEVIFTLDVKSDVAGEKQFNIEVISGAEIVTTQPIQVTIQESSGFGGITGNVIGSGNTYLWAIGFLNVILIVAIIIVAIRVARK